MRQRVRGEVPTGLRSLPEESPYCRPNAEAGDGGRREGGGRGEARRTGGARGVETPGVLTRNSVIWSMGSGRGGAESAQAGGLRSWSGSSQAA
eukprot:13369673-Alexandrium_andersonii.AAC.1